eukprot:Phypoly_transcript_10574.p1 GENE.Phypoly_transcript_10574~~Phypoly_transcript_10574.p1  ORF type:complete len:364 (-),score=66.37 Phypoly_transcript_10574:66-1157(-)
MATEIIELGQELVSYDNSLFTNAHDLVSPAPVHDGRGTFSHLGVMMEGLESSRHWNFKHTKNTDGSLSFFRDENVVNNVETILRQPSTRALVHRLVFDTSFYTNNPTKDIYSVVLVDELEGTEKEVVTRLKLKGHAVETVTLPSPVPATRFKLRMGEGGLARFRVFGTPLPPLPVPTNVLKGAKVIWASDASYGTPESALREEREGKVMAGWESKRHSARHALIVAIPGTATATKILVDTYMHCLNAFQFISIFAGNFKTENTNEIVASLPKWKLVFPDGRAPELVEDAKLNEFFESNNISNVHYQQDVNNAGPWKLLLPMSQLKRDTLHEYTNLVSHTFTHLAFVGVPDGGVHRLVVFGSFV